MRNSQLCVAAAIIVIAVALAAVPAALAETQGSGGLVYETSDDGTASVVGYTGDPVSVHIPETVSLDGSEYRVTSIGDEAFADCDTLREVTGMGAVISIGMEAFARCESLVSVEIPDTVESFGSLSFCECPSLESLRIPDGVTEIPESMFQWSDSLRTVYIGSGVRIIDYYAFYGCESLEDVVLPESLEEIYVGAFMDCSSLTSVHIPDSVTLLDYGAFAGCSSIPEVTGMGGVTELPESVFEGCSSLGSFTVLSCVEYIQPMAFAGCISIGGFEVEEGNTSYIGCEGSVLTADGSILVLAPGNMEGTYVVPDTVTELYEGVFLGSALTSIDVGDAVSEIPRMVFRDSAELVSIRIGPSVSYISYDVFDGCASLLCIDVSPDNPAYSSEEGILYDHDGTTLIRCPQGISGSLTIDMPVRTVEDGAFWGCSLLTHVEFPDGMTSMGTWVFDGCASLLSVGIPDSVTQLGYACLGDSGITEFTVPAGVTSMSGVLYRCADLAWIDVSPENTAFVSEDGVLYSKDMTVLVKVPSAKEGDYTIRDGVIDAGGNPFSNCSRITSITVPDSVTSLVLDNGCDSLRVLRIGASLTGLDSTDLGMLENLERIEVSPDNPVFASADGVLYSKDMTTLLALPCAYPEESFTVPDTVTSIGAYSMMCNGLRTLIIPASVTHIGDVAVSIPTLETLVYMCTGSENESYWMDGYTTGAAGLTIYTDDPAAFDTAYFDYDVEFLPLDMYEPESEDMPGIVYALLTVTLAMAVVGIAGRRD